VGKDNRDREEIRLELEIKAAHGRTRQTYGPESYSMTWRSMVLG
jgi:hypothetical protein